MPELIKHQHHGHQQSYFALIFAAYITGGIFIVLWMEENYFDARYGRKA